ncbi:LPXTG cell wall anchor domain-containing protein [Phytoactinopolyspora endophytica]|uniref:LPXTG cell wall anchor domain-containing protein n=1 Tax=Phytoactinopolyspora endophytica TaxID=1642495 RepID=UPI00101B67D9|nr:LPXTG cell wall anchor domain-containing protein [Phytoactinopolyspora endophytica]
MKQPARRRRWQTSVAGGAAAGVIALLASVTPAVAQGEPPTADTFRVSSGTLTGGGSLIVADGTYGTHYAAAIADPESTDEAAQDAIPEQRPRASIQSPNDDPPGGDDDDLPNTGDGTGPLAWIGFAMIAAGAGLFYRLRRGSDQLT